MRNASARSGTYRGRRRLVMWMGLVSLLMSLMGPTFTLWADDAVAARGEEQQQECDPGFVYDDTLGYCVEEEQQPDCPEGEVYDPNSQGCVADPNYQQPEDENTSGIQIEKWDCTAAEPGWGYNEFTSSEDCQQASNQITFYHGGDGLTEESQNGPGYYEWTEQPAGNHYVYEDIPDGYGTPRVFCTFYDPNEGGPSSPSETNVQNGNAVGWNLEPGQYAYCYWFNIQEGYGQINITKYDCADFTEDPTQATWQYLQSECKTWSGDPVEYQLWSGQQQVDSASTGSGGQASFDQAPAGNVTVAEVLPEGYTYSIVYCWYHPANPQNGAAQEDYQPVQVQDGSYHEWNLEPGYVLDCYWFNFYEQTGSTIDFYKYVCAYDTPFDQDYEYYFENCQPREGWDFEVTWNDGGSTESTDRDGKASWTGVPQGDWSGSEDLDDSWDQPKVWCRYVEWPDEADYDNNFFPYDPSGGQIDRTFEYDGVHIECYWFNFEYEGGDYNWVDFYKYTCPYDLYEQGGSWDYFSQECSPLEDWDFDVSWDGGGSTETTDGSGLASWPSVPQGSWTGSEQVPDGWEQPYVYCRYVEWPDDADYSDEWTQWDVSDGSIDWEFEYDSGVRVECYWFNFAPDNYNWVDFYKYTCPYDLYEGGGSYEYFFEECSPLEDWNFNLAWDGGGNDQTTDPDGKASWSGVPGGTWTGSETLGEGWYEPYIYCRYVEWPDEAGYDNEWFEVTSSGGSFDWEYEYDSGIRIECYWFNFAPDNYNWVDFYKYTCPYDLYEQGGSYDYFIQECEALQDWPFDLTWDGGGSTVMTDSSGLASWSGVPQGAWVGSEDVPDGWAEPHIYCRYVEWPDGADYTDEWIDITSSGGSFDWEFEDESGVRIECYWFNFEPDEYNWVDFYKYTCPYDIYDASGSWDYFSQECTPTEGWEFTVGWGDGANESKTTGTDGLASWSGVPTESWWGQEDVPGGYEQPVVWCRYAEWPDEAGYDNEWTQYTVTDGRIDASFDYDGVRIECYWFNFEPEGGSWIQFYKLWCSEEATYDASFDDLLNTYCEYRSDQPAEISLTYGGSTSTKSATGDSPAEWQGVPAGEWTVEETEYDGWGQPIIWCQYVEWPEGTDGYDQEPWQLETQGWQATWSHEDDGLRIACVIFNIPYQENWVEITKWWCSEDVTTPYEREYTELQESCETYTEGVDFTLAWDGGSETKTTDGEGYAEWGGLPGGNWSMEESVPSGYGDPVVWCYWVEWPTGTELSDEPYSFTAPHGSFTGSFQWSGMRIHCDIFNIPDYDPGWITVYKWYCATGVPTDSNPEYLRDECEIVTTGVEFNLEYGETTVPMTTDSTGKAEWTDVPVGSWTLTETVSDGYGTPVIYCQWVEWADMYDSEYTQDLYQPEQEGASVTGTHQYPGLKLVCYWFNFEYEGGDHWVTFYKYYCPPGSEWGEDINDWVENCQSQDGVHFTMTGDMTSVPKSTAGGMAEWKGVEDGTYTFSEELPEGYAEPLLWCTRIEYTPGEAYSDLTDLSTFESASAPEGSWETTIEGGPWRIVCYWFNIPNNESTITIYKYNCEYKPAGYSTLWQWQEACSAKGDGIDFTLDTSDGSSTKETTDGKVWWGNLPTGEFTITESPVAGYGTPVIWCAWTAYYDGAVYDAPPSQYDEQPGVIKGSIDYPGSTWTCWVFNIPDDHSKIVIFKYNCPDGGQGMMSSGDFEDYQYACKEYGDGVDFTLENSGGSSTRTITDGSASWYDVPEGGFTLTETVPEGYGEAIWWCGYVGWEGGAVYDGKPTLAETPGGVFTGSIDFDVTYYFCFVFNFPDYEREITVYKWWCPSDWSPESESYEDWKEACSTPIKGVGFELSWDGGSSYKGTNSSGRASWYGLDWEQYTLTEQYLPGYESPYVFCSFEGTGGDETGYSEPYTWYDVTDRSVSRDTSGYGNYKWVCHFFNIEKGPGEITVYKWNCPPGYDPHKWGADPTKDCTQARNDVDFVLDRPSGPDVTRTTGDDGEGAVYWGELDPGYYVIREKVPSDTDYVFIWDCYGGDLPAVHPNPLQWGPVLNVKVAGGDSIVCQWYNVPYPDNGWVTLYKYQCWTKTYTSDVDCELYEFGASFELFTAEGNESQGTGTTNAGGTYTWGDLEEGGYTLDEISHQPCKITSTKVTESGDIWVDTGQETIVKVYNCAPDKGTPTPGGKVPTKYPNTGVGESGDVPVTLPQDGGDDEDTGIIEPDSEDNQSDEGADGTPTEQEAAAEFYSIACIEPEGDQPSGRSPGTGDGDGSGDGNGSGTQDAADDDLPPFLQGTSSDEPDEPAATEEPTDGGEDQAATTDDECIRGSIPEQVVIDAADVNHPVEVLEILDGVMQAPSGPEYVSWYKETARLGEQNNMVIAAHVNWWGVPEGPFFNLAGLQEGDTIQITGEDGKIYVFEVQWVRQESNLDAPNPEVVGPTGEATLTLITCGGEWDPSISEYNERTVVRAIQVDVIDPGTTGNANDDTASPESDEEDNGQSLPAPVAMIRSIWTERIAA